LTLLLLDSRIEQTMNMISTTAGKSATLCRLRQAVARLDGHETSLASGARALAFGVAEIDRALGGGLAPASLHEIAASTWQDLGSAIGFTLALTARTHQRRETLWIQTDFAALESGNLYSPGCEAFGFPSHALLFVKVPRPLDALWGMEEALKSHAFSNVICELPGDGAIADLIATQRLTLAAREGGALGFLLRHHPSRLTSTAETRWKISATPSAPDRFGGLGYTAFTAALMKNRRGAEAQWTIVWNHHECSFAALSRSVAQAAFDRPDRALLARIA
jgi:protein ImuA